jgi:hypothetical protein
MKTKKTFVVVLFITILIATVAPAEAQKKSILRLAENYSSALKTFQTRKTPVSLENVLRKGLIVTEKLDELENLSESDYSLLEKKMKGFLVNRTELVFIEPDLKFFSDLAAKRGTKADAAFFGLMREFKPNSVWAAYIEQQTDVTGCTIYGNGLLTKLYGKALQFKKKYPKSYVREVDEETDNILLNAFSDNVCACGDRNSVLKEYRSFIKTFPTDKKTPAVKKNLTTLEKSKDARFNCQSG